jgi:hypothetical protein
LLFNTNYVTIHSATMVLITGWTSIVLYCLSKEITKKFIG